jgi:error-prone DNA polymerase
MYVELHCHSGYSFLDGASHPEELVLAARDLGYPALALTDHDGLYGSMEFAQAARAEGLQAVTGAEVTISGILERVGGSEPSSHPSEAPPHRPDTPVDRSHAVVLAETPTGYANLCRILTRCRMESPREDPHLPLDVLLEHGDGIIVLTGCRKGVLARALEWGGTSGAERLARTLLEGLGPTGLFVELQEHRVRGDGRRNRALGTLADRLGVPVVATGNVHYHRPERSRLHDVLTALRHRQSLDASHGIRRSNGQFYLAPPEEMATRFESRPDAVLNTLEIARRCAAFDLTRDLGYVFPDFQGAGNGKTADQLLAEVCRARLDEKYPDGTAPGAGGGDGPISLADRRARKRRAEAEARLEEELRLVAHYGLSGFFLVYRDIMEMGREVAARIRGDSPRARAGLPPGRGRGSSVSSIICYLIGLSHIDPIEADLFLGRFLNEALRSVPDIDLDFPRDIREELILEIYRRYGNDHAGLVCTFPTYRLKSAVREIGKALELPQGEVEKLAKLADRYSAAGLREEMARIPDFADKADQPPWTLLAALAEDIARLPRHVSQHVGGMIISSRPLIEIVPLEPAAWEGRVLCQWDKDSCEDAGFIKIDFLALGMLSLVEEAVDLIADRGTAGAGGEPIVAGAPDLSRIDFQDETVFDRICSGDTIGMFQVESRAQIQMVRRVRPRNLRDLAIQVAIVRPGPIVGGAVNPYVRRRELQRADPDFQVPLDHPLLAEPLEETLGVIIYQDQVLQVCKALAGFSDGQAEGLRRAMSRKRSREAMTEYWEAFREGARRNGVDEATARKVFEQVVAFSEFGFPKSHAHAFGLLAYQSAWLRHYYPTEYNVALFNNQPMGFYGLDALARDARRNGIAILLPCVNRSRVACTAEGDDLRVGLGFVRGVGANVAETIVAERERHGPFRSLPDFLRRTPSALKRPAVENLIWVGGMETLGLTRRELLWQTGLFLGPESDPARVEARQSDGQLGLALDEPLGDLPFPGLEPGEQMMAEYRMLRFSSSLHPLDLVRGRLPPETILSDALLDLPQGSTVCLAGLVVARQRPLTAKGYVFVLMEDESNPINVIVKPDLYAKCHTIVRAEPLIWVRGRLQKDGGTLNIIALHVEAVRLDAPFPRLPNGTPAPRDVGQVTPPPMAWLGVEGATEVDEPPTDLGKYLTAIRQNPPDVKNFG